MRQLRVLALLVMSVATGFAQPGLIVGAAFDHQHRVVYDLESNEKNQRTNIGFAAGFLYRSNVFGKRFVTEPSLVYVRKGAQYQRDGFITEQDHTLEHLDYIQFSLPLLYQIKLSKSAAFTIGPGVYAACLLKARRFIYYPDDPIPEITNLPVGNKPPYNAYKPFDIGLCFAAEFKYKRWMCRGGFDRGLTNVDPLQSNNGGTIRNRSWILTLGALL